MSAEQAIGGVILALLFVAVWLAVLLLSADWTPPDDGDDDDDPDW